jgi:WD40 repeat protein
MKGKPIVLSPDGRVLAAGGKSVQLFEFPSANKLHRLTSDHLKKIQAIAFSPDGRLVFGGGSYGTTNIWSAETGELLVTLFAFAETECNGAVTDQWLALRPDGYYDGSPGVERFMAWRRGRELQTGASQEHELRHSAAIAAALSE